MTDDSTSLESSELSNAGWSPFWPNEPSPRLLYKYLSYKDFFGPQPWGCVVDTQQITWSCPLVFNDPFDCVWNTAAELDTPAYRKYNINTFLYKLENGFDPRDVSFSGLSDLNKLHAGFLSLSAPEQDRFLSNIASFIDKAPVEHAANLKSIVQAAALNFRCLCLSEVRDSILMWSHYADSHKGVVLGLSAAQLAGREVRQGKVRYFKKFPSVIDVKNRTPFFLESAARSFKSKVFATKLYFSKATCWKYEKEWRFFRWRSDKNSPLRVSHAIPTYCVREVILGSNCHAGPDAICRIQSALPSARILRATPSLSHYAIDINAI